MTLSDPTNERREALIESLETIETLLRRLDQRRHVTPSRLEVSHVHGERRWVAQIMADPLVRPLVGSGVDAADAMCSLAEELVTAKVRRRRR